LRGCSKVCTHAFGSMQLVCFHAQRNAETETAGTSDAAKLMQAAKLTDEECIPSICSVTAWQCCTPSSAFVLPNTLRLHSVTVSKASWRLSKRCRMEGLWSDCDQCAAAHMHTRQLLKNASLPCLPVTTVRSPTRFPLPNLATSTLPPGAESSGRRIRTLPYRIKYSLSPLSPYLISASPFCTQLVPVKYNIEAYCFCRHAFGRFP